MICLTMSFAVCFAFQVLPQAVASAEYAVLDADAAQAAVAVADIGNPAFAGIVATAAAALVVGSPVASAAVSSGFVVLVIGAAGAAVAKRLPCPCGLLVAGR